MTTTPTSTSALNEITEETLFELAPAHPERAKTLGLRLIAARPGDAAALRALPSLGSEEDAITEWAIANPARARTVLLALAVRLARR